MTGPCPPNRPDKGGLPVGIEPADLALCDGASTFLQSGFWGGFKARFGWEALPFLVRWKGGACGPLLVLSRSLFPGFSFTYVPRGPQLPLEAQSPQTFETDALASLAGLLRSHLRRNTAFIRFDPPWYSFAEAPPHIGPPLLKAPSNVQAPDTVLVNLVPPPEVILAGMKPKWRYNIGLAEKKGVTVRQFSAFPALTEETGQALTRFYTLLQETAERDGIAIHGFEYYRGLFVHAAEYRPLPSTPPPDLRLYLALYGDQALAGIVTLFRGSEGVYLYGASSGLHRNLMAPYALQWAAMKDARESGCRSYDLFGIPPSPDPSHPMAGLYRFKTGFAAGGIIHLPGSWDYPCRPLPARLYRIAEGLRKRFMDHRKGRPPRARP
jgi:lipid II:glycine glycyltransferase (peptidoglycan interpeptide bridge formation enzyme)